MELSCPSCGSKHRTEDYLGAFEIQCACGYSILVPDEASLLPKPEEDLSPPPSFDDAPMAMEHHDENAKVALANTNSEISLDPDLIAAQAQDTSQGFSALDLTPPEQLPDGMPYDPFELQTQWKDEAVPDPINNESPSPPPAPPPRPQVEAQDIVNRIQMASIGYMHGALFDLELAEMPDSQIRKLAEHCTQVLQIRPWLREYIDAGFDAPENLFKQKQLSAVPELLAVEIYLHCAQNEIRCALRAHST
jgi:hypothetical protein